MQTDRPYHWRTLDGSLYLNSVQVAAYLDHFERCAVVRADLPPEQFAAAVGSVLAVATARDVPLAEPRIFTMSHRAPLPRGYARVNSYRCRVTSA